MLVVKNPPAGAGDIRDAGSFLENSTERGACSVHGVTESDMTEVTQHTQSKWGPQYSQRNLYLSDCFLFFLY